MLCTVTANMLTAREGGGNCWHPARLGCRLSFYRQHGNVTLSSCCNVHNAN